MRDVFRFTGKHLPMHVLNRFVHKRSEENRVRPHRRKFKFPEKLVLQGAVLIKQDMARKGIAVLHVAFPDCIQVQFRHPLFKKNFIVGNIRIDTIEIFRRRFFRRIGFRAGKHEQIFCTAERRIVEPPKVEILDTLQGVPRFLLAIKPEDFLIDVFIIFPRNRIERIHAGNRKFQSLALVDCHDADASGRRHHVKILVFIDSAILQELEIFIEKFLQNLFALFPVRHNRHHAVHAFKPAEQFGEQGQVICRAQIFHTAVEFCRQ